MVLLGQGVKEIDVVREKFVKRYQNRGNTLREEVEDMMRGLYGKMTI